MIPFLRMGQIRLCIIKHYANGSFTLLYLLVWKTEIAREFDPCQEIDQKSWKCHRSVGGKSSPGKQFIADFHLGLCQSLVASFLLCLLYC